MSHPTVVPLAGRWIIASDVASDYPTRVAAAIVAYDYRGGYPQTHTLSVPPHGCGLTPLKFLPCSQPQLYIMQIPEILTVVSEIA